MLKGCIGQNCQDKIVQKRKCYKPREQQEDTGKESPAKAVMGKKKLCPYLQAIDKSTQ